MIPLPLPAVNATLNATSAAFLIAGYFVLFAAGRSCRIAFARVRRSFPSRFFWPFTSASTSMRATRASRSRDGGRISRPLEIAPMSLCIGHGVIIYWLLYLAYTPIGAPA
ncbi:MAG: hypothetical protein ABSA57_11950 [Candidatus Acidiferrales bacterium]|jgi:hypothetical protein